MKINLSKVLIFISALGVVSAASAQSTYDKIYVIPTNATGAIIPTGENTYEGMVELADVEVDNEHHFRVDNVELKYPAFALLGHDPTSGDKGSTLFQLITYAVRPIPLNYPSPLIAGTEKTAIIQLDEAGTYSFDFFARDIEGISTHMIIVTTDDKSKPQYPDQIYLVDSSNKTVEISGNPNNGFYQATVTVPSSFRVSYEPIYNVDAFVFGPVNGTGESATGTINLEQGIRQSIKYAKGTEATFTADSATKTPAGTTEVSISIPAGYIVLSNNHISGVEDVATDSEVTPTYYTLSGTPLPERPTVPGIYIERGSSVRKIAIGE